MMAIKRTHDVPPSTEGPAEPFSALNPNDQTRREPLVLKLAEVAELTRLSIRTITRLEKSLQFPRRLPHYGRPHYRRSDVLRWIDGGWSLGRAFGRRHPGSK